MSVKSDIQDYVEKLVKSGKWTRHPRWGHLYREENGKKHRLKVQEHTLRHEVQVTHEGTEFSKPTKSWVRIKTYRVKKKVS